MAALRLRRLLPPAALLLALLAGAAALERAWTGWQQARSNEQMALAEPPRDGVPRVLLARAIVLEQQGRIEEALSDYAEVEVLGDAALRHAARVNVANLYLRRGIAVARDDGHAQRALVLLQLAKAGYRRALRQRPDDWDARYNLELAQRLLPDLEPRNWRRSGDEAELSEAMKKDKAAWTDMVGQPRGMH
ncbi:tetratricopeptide repeat protein [Rubrivivax gelatinosus]|uniref:MxaK protein n=1 Tax=Rubrivivax gelatinosus TaxID=28068 RepID=A0ABS1DXS7_RUBGE|nr:hypothetical protein [Rubrivivax gelatinosus]MBK1714891.1 hypothetical protein [Rubrivivax gelatinosus]